MMSIKNQNKMTNSVDPDETVHVKGSSPFAKTLLEDKR